MSGPQELIARVREGMDVRCADGKRVGGVGEVHIGTAAGEATSQTTTEERSFFEVRRGLLGLGEDFYVPAELIRQVDDEGVLLRCTSGEMGGEVWATRPGVPEEREDSSATAIGLSKQHSASGVNSGPAPTP